MTASDKPTGIRLLTIDEAADRLRCSRTHVYDLIAAGFFSVADISARPGRSKSRVVEADVDEYIQSRIRRRPKKGAA